MQFYRKMDQGFQSVWRNPWKAKPYYISHLMRICTVFVKNTTHFSIFYSLLVLLLLGFPFLQFSQAQEQAEYLLFHSLSLGKTKVEETLFTPDGSFLLTLARKHKLEIWSSRSGSRLRVIPTALHEAISLATHPSKPLVFTGGKDDTIRIWDIQQAVTKGTLRGHLSDVTALTTNISGSRLVSGSIDGSLFVWDVAQQTVIASLENAHSGKITSVAIHPNGQTLVSGGPKGELRLWSLPDLQKMQDLYQHQKEVTQVGFNLHGNLMVSSSVDQTLTVWEWETGQPLHTLQQHEAAVTGFDLHIDGKTLVSGGRDQKILLWDILQGTQTGQLPSVVGRVSKVRFDENGQQIGAAFDNGQVVTWQWGISTKIASLNGHQRSITATDFSANGKYLATAAQDNTIRIWDVVSQESVRSYQTNSHRVETLRFAPDSTKFATGGGDATVILWDTQKGEHLNTLKKHHGKVNTIAFHPDQKHLISGGSDQQWVLWDLESGTAIRHKKGHNDQINSVAISPRGDLFATGGSDRTIHLWNTDTGLLLGSMRGHNRAIVDLVFHPSQPLLATTSQDMLIFIWDVSQPQTPKLKVKMEGHNSIINRILFSKRGQRLLSISHDKTIRMWDTSTGNMIRILSGEDSPLITGSITPDGQLIAVGSLAGEITLLGYPLRTAELEERQYTKTNYHNAPQLTTDAGVQAQFISESGESTSLVTSLEDIADQNDLLESEERIPTPTEVEAYAVPPLQQETANRRQQMQKKLNNLHRQGKVCNHLQPLRETAVEILREIPNDLAAYHALLKMAVVQKDIQLLMLTGMLGAQAKFHENEYDYLPQLEVQRRFSYWIDQIFDPAFRRKGGELRILYRNCQGIEELLTIPNHLFLLRPPQEFFQKSLMIPRFLEIRDFFELSREEFKNRLFADVLRAANSDKPHPQARLPIPKDQAVKVIQTGEVALNLDQVLTWRNAGRVKFQLRKANGNWLSYLTADDNIAVLELPVGNYYLRVGKKIRETFILAQDKQLALKIQ